MGFINQLITGGPHIVGLFSWVTHPKKIVVLADTAPSARLPLWLSC